MGLYQLWTKGREFDRLYNCSFYNVDDVPLDKREHRFFAILVSIMGLVFMLLYLPCIYALSHRKLLKSNVYKIMLMMSFQDMITLACTTLFPGYMSYHGYVYCSKPELSLYFGSIIISFWLAYSQTSLLLAVNRCLCLSRFQHVFESKFQYFLMFLPWVVSIYALIFGPSASYSSISNVWVFDPHHGYHSDLNGVVYSSAIQYYNNIVFIICIPLFYGVFVSKNLHLLNNGNRGMSKEIALFVQTLVVNVTIAMSALGYTLLQYFPDLPPAVISATHLSWVLVQGAPPLVYLTMNQSIRRIVLKSAKELSNYAKYSQTAPSARLTSALQQPTNATPSST